MLGNAYGQAGKALDEMAIKDEKEDERDRKDSFVVKDGSPGLDQRHAERKHTYRSSVEKQQKMHDILMEKVIALQNALMDHEREIYCYYEKEFAEVTVEIMELREDWRIESRNHEEDLDVLQNKSMLLFICSPSPLLSFHLTSISHGLVTISPGTINCKNSRSLATTS